MRAVVRTALLAVALVVHAAMALFGIADKSATLDEGAHIAGGTSYWLYGDYRLQPENGNWPQRWMALPLVARADSFPSPRGEEWETSNVWRIAERYLYASGHDADALLFASRTMIVVVSAAVCLLVFLWSRQLFGAVGAWTSLAITTFSPTMLAHGALATSDMMAAAFYLAATWAIWTALHRVSWSTVTLSVVTTAGLLLSKFSAPIAVPLALTLIAVRIAGGRPMRIAWRDRRWEIATRKRVMLASAGLLAIHTVLAVAIIWASYSFRYAAMSPELPGGAFLTGWPVVLSELGALARVIEWFRAHELLPEAYLYGLANVAYFARHRVSFLNGEFSDTGGWVGFFPYAAAVKETLPVLLLIASAAALLLWRATRQGTSDDRRLRDLAYRAAPLAILIAVYWVFALSTNLNIGHRHLLPTLPPTYILLGSLGAYAHSAWGERIQRSSRRALVSAGTLALLIAWHMIESVRIAPHYLAYFNQLDGGPRQAYLHLVDSSLDWGQDLPGLKRWLDAHAPAGSAVYLSYFGHPPPAYFGIEAHLLPSFPDRWTQRPPRAWTGGIYAVSATMLQAVYLDYPGEWTRDHEEKYQTTLENLRVFAGTDGNASQRAALLRQTGEEFWWKVFKAYDELRFARLAAWLRTREPDAHVGYSILLYRLTDADVAGAITGPVPNAAPRP